MIVLLIIMSMAVITDFRYYKIPNSYILTGTLAGFMLRLFQEGISSCFTAIFYVMLIFLFLFPFFIMHGMGAGDIKLFCMMAVYLHAKRIMLCFFMTFVIAAMISIIKMIYRGVFLEKVWKIYHYLQAVILTQSYREYEEKNYMKAKENTIRMSLPALLSVTAVFIGECIGVLL